MVPLDRQVLRSATEAERAHSLTAQDAIVLASVLRHLEEATPAPSCFLNRDVRGFANEDIAGRLGALGCRLIPNFSDGLGYIRNALAEGAA